MHRMNCNTMIRSDFWTDSFCDHSVSGKKLHSDTFDCPKSQIHFEFTQVYHNVHVLKRIRTRSDLVRRIWLCTFVNTFDPSVMNSIAALHAQYHQLGSVKLQKSSMETVPV